MAARRRADRQDYELQRGGIANSGTVEAVAPLPGRRDQYVVVTRERTTATDTTAYQGLRPAWHVALATVVRAHARRGGSSAAGSPRAEATRQCARDVEHDRDREARQRQRRGSRTARGRPAGR